MVIPVHAGVWSKKLIFLVSSMDSGPCCDGIQQKRDHLLIFAGAPVELKDLWTRERLRQEERCRVDVEGVQLKAVEDETSKERKQ